MNSFQGHFLVAAPHQLDPNFTSAVILVCGHNNRGAFGVIVNDFAEENQCSQQCNSRWRCSENEKLFWGGPVTGPLMAVHTQTFLGERQLLSGVFFSRKESNVRTLLLRPEQYCKFFIGYAGWSSGQLEYEVEQGIWRVVPATPRQIFGDTGDLWVRLSRQASRMQLQTMFNIRHISSNPLLN
jgi:putative transcriptional regulator